MKITTLILLLLTLTFPLFAATFLENEKTAFAQSKKQGKPLLIYFYGIWCPPCNELKEVVFEDPEFTKRAEKFVLLKVDVDAKASWKIKDRYRVGGYPTLIFVSPNGKEIYRFAGYRNPKEFTRLMDMALAAKNQDVTRSCKKSDADSLWFCASVCGDRKDTKCANEALAKLEKMLKPGEPRYLLASTYIAESAETSELKRDAFERLLRQYPSSPQALIWAFAYSDTFEDTDLKPKNELLEKVLANGPQMMKDPSLDELGISNTDVAMLRAELYEKVGTKDAAVAAWKEASTLLEQRVAEMPKGATARGFTMERISCLNAAGETDKALKLANEYREQFPHEFTFHYIVASILNRQKKYNDSLPIAKTAYQHSYGDNKIRAGTLLIKLYATVPDRASAEKIFNEVTKEINPDAKLQVRTHKHLKALNTAWQEFPRS